jgi:hypothetical protein
MKRRGNVISPIDSINTVVEMLQQTDYTVEDGETVWVRSTQAMYVYRVNSGLVPDGTTVIASIYGNGVWQKLNVAPAGGSSLGPFNTVAQGSVGSGRLLDVNSSQLAALTIGSTVWVNSVFTSWTWDPTSTLTADNITICNPTANGVNPGRFIRATAPVWKWENQLNWFIDQTNGNDEFDGTSQTFTSGVTGPLKSYDEYVRRVAGHNGVIRPPTIFGVTVTQVGNYTAVGSSTGRVDLVIDQYYPGAQFTLIGVLPAASFTGTLSAITSITRGSTGVAGNYNQATSTWTPATELGRLVHNTTQNRWSWIAADLGAGATVLAPWVQISSFGSLSLSQSNASNNDGVETLALPTIDSLQITVTGNFGQGPGAWVVVQNFNITNASSNTKFIGLGGNIIVQNCIIANPHRMLQGGLTTFNNCQLTGGSGNIMGEPMVCDAVFNAGLWRDMVGSQGTIITRGSNIQMNTFALLQNSPITVQQSSVLAIGDLQARGTNTPVTVIDATMRVSGNGGFGQGGSPGNTTAGLVLKRGAKLRYGSGAVLNCSAAADFLLQAATTAYAWDDANHVYTATRRNLTWTLLQTTFGGGGFGDAIFDPLTLATACLDA